MKEPLAVCWGAGVDSTAMPERASRDHQLRRHGAEKPDTYSFIPIFPEWLRDHGRYQGDSCPL
jgi:hypothetical protein